MGFKKYWCVLSVFVCVVSLGTGQVLSQELTHSLNGEWQWTPEGLPQRTLSVPGFYVSKKCVFRYTFDENVSGPWAVVEGVYNSVYEREFNVPITMAGKRLYLRFESVNYVARITLNGSVLMVHQGGYLPFEIDITDRITAPSNNNHIQVEILYEDYRFLFTDEKPLWPTGCYGLYWDSGITGDVTLIAREGIYVSDLILRTSIQPNKLFVSAEVINHRLERHTISLDGAVLGGPVLTPIIVELAAGDTNFVHWSIAWDDVDYWWPDHPKLYFVNVNAKFEGEVVSTFSARLGFREVEVRGHQFYLNGIPWRLMGDSYVLDSEKHLWTWGYPTPENTPVMLDRMKALGISHLRMHQQPAPPWLLDLCDTKGFTVVAESAIYGCVAERSSTFISNAHSWLRDWIRRDKNHPCVVSWSIENEMVFLDRMFLENDIQAWGETVKRCDPTRPILCDGDGDVDGAMDFFSVHYPLGWPNQWDVRGPFSERLQQTVRSEKPICVGEYEWTRGEISENERVRRQAVKMRVMRMLDWAEIRPYRLDWMWHPNAMFNTGVYWGWTCNTQDIIFMEKSLSRVAVFDKKYYDKYFFPGPPSSFEGDQVHREVVLINDGRSESPIEMNWAVVCNGRCVETGVQQYQIMPGEAVEDTLYFHAPIIDVTQNYQLRLSLLQDQKVCFSDTLLFKSIENGIFKPSQPSVVQGLKVERMGASLLLSWRPVVEDIEKKPVEITKYRIYRLSSPNWEATAVDSFDVNHCESFLDATSGLFEVSTKTIFYSIVAIINDGCRSERSELFGVQAQRLCCTGTTDFNLWSMPWSSADYSMAGELVDQSHEISGIAQWVASGQGINQYLEQVSVTNFQLNPNVYFLNVNADTTLLVSGVFEVLQYAMHRYQPTAFHFIVMPYHSPEISRASMLQQNIPDCDCVAYWDVQNQCFVQYVPGLSDTDFDVYPGQSLMVHVQASVLWPDSGQQKMVDDAQSHLSSWGLNSGMGLPHVVWGRRNVKKKEFFGLMVSLNGSEPVSVPLGEGGHCFTDLFWCVQLSPFGAWEPGDELLLIFLDGRGQSTIERKMILNAEPAQEISLEGSTKQSGQSEALISVYPNPFHSTCHFAIRSAEGLRTKVMVYDVMGRKIKTLMDNILEHEKVILDWDGSCDQGKRQPSGVYTVQCISGSNQLCCKVIYIQ